MKILYDKEKCIRCGLCASICPPVFVLHEEGIEVLQKENGAADEKTNERLIDDMKMAETSCPVKAIAIIEE